MPRKAAQKDAKVLPVEDFEGDIENGHTPDVYWYENALSKLPTYADIEQSASPAQNSNGSDSLPDVIYEYSVSFEEEILNPATPHVDSSPSRLVSNRKSRVRPESGFAVAAAYKHAAHFSAPSTAHLNRPANRKQTTSSRSNERNPGVVIEEVIIPDSSVMARRGKEEALPMINGQTSSSRAVVPFVSPLIYSQTAGASSLKETEIADCSQRAEVPKKRDKTSKAPELPMTADEAGGGNSPPPCAEAHCAKPGPKDAGAGTKTAKLVQETMGALGLENEAFSDDSSTADPSPAKRFRPLEKRPLVLDADDSPTKKVKLVKSTVIRKMPLEGQAVEPAKPRRGRGRPRKVPVGKTAGHLDTEVMTAPEAAQPMKAGRGRGRPRKVKGEASIITPANQQDTRVNVKVDVTMKEKETNLEDSQVKSKAAAAVIDQESSDEAISLSRKRTKRRNVPSSNNRSPSNSEFNISDPVNSSGTEQPTVCSQKEHDVTGMTGHGEIKNETQNRLTETADVSKRRKKPQLTKCDLGGREKCANASRVKDATVVKPLQLEPKLARILGMRAKEEKVISIVPEKPIVPEEQEVVEIVGSSSYLPAKNVEDDLPLQCSATQEADVPSSAPDCVSDHAAKPPAAVTASDTTTNNVPIPAKGKSQRAAKPSKSRKKADNLATNLPRDLADLALPIKDAVKDFGSEGHPKISTAALERIADAGGSKSQRWIGCHVSAYGGVVNAVRNAAETGCFSFAFFLRSPRSWIAKDLTDEVVLEFKDAMNKYGYLPSQVLPHGSYLLNVGSADHEKWTKSRDTLLDEAKRCERLGLQLYNFHPGSAVGGGTTEECIGRIAKAINYVIANTDSLVILIETMCGQGKTVGGSFAELRAIIDLVENKSRIGVCFDTCHVWAAGYDIKSEKGYAETMREFETVIGLEYLKAVHLNDSIKAKGCHLDRHERIGKGTIGTRGFWNIMNDSRFNGMPMVLETPDGGIYTDEIELLYKLETV